MKITILCIWCCSCNRSHLSLSSVSVPTHLFCKKRIEEKKVEFRIEPEVVVVCHLLLDPVRLKAMDEKSPTNDKTRIKRASKQVYHLNGSKSPKIPVKSSSPSFSEGATFATTGAFVDDLTTNNLKMCLN